MNIIETMSPVEAGRLLGVGRGTAYKLCRTGQIPCLRLGKKLRVPIVALRSLLADPASSSGAATPQAGGDDEWRID